jgi:acetoin utilization deacetylase AcuC-like enzyme
MARGRCTGNNHSIVTVWDDRYCVAAAPTNSTTKQRRVVELAGAENLLDLRPAQFEDAHAWPAIAEVHDPAYVEAVRTGEPRHRAESQGFTWSPAFAASVARIWQGHLAACRLATSARLVLHPVSGAHHAGYARGSGYCTFNFLIGAARSLLASGLDAVAIVDLDAHPGDGTYQLAKADPRIALFDIAGGVWVSVIGTPQVEYHDVRDSAAYRRALAALPAFLDRVRPALVQYQAGMDPFEEDPVGGIAGVDVEFLRFRDRFVIAQALSRGIPLVINLAGGYIDDVTERLHLETVRIASDIVTGPYPERDRNRRRPGPESAGSCDE